MGGMDDNKNEYEDAQRLIGNRVHGCLSVKAECSCIIQG